MGVACHIGDAQRLTLRCGLEVLSDEVSEALQQTGFAPTHPLVLLLDAPVGFALAELMMEKLGNAVVVTDNPCPEYWDDLWDLQPQILLAGGHSLQEILHALNRALTGERYRKTPYIPPVLTRRERDVLRLSAMAKSNAEIASQLGIGEKTVKNHLSNIYSKLNLSHRGQLQTYYWGQWLWLPGNWQLPHWD